MVKDEETNHSDKFVMHGQEISQYLDGGSALHLNLDEALSAYAYVKLFNVDAATVCNYFCINITITVVMNVKK